MTGTKVQTVLFDLDGTLLDTAPDLADALNAVLQANGRSAMQLEEIRPAVSHGGRALIELGFGSDAEYPEFEARRLELLTYYEDNIARHTRLFPGMENVLEEIEVRGLNWGVVTNKPGWLTDPLMEALRLDTRAASIVSGDTLKESKPHPAPLLHACKLIGSVPEHCMYVGDAERDIQSGRRAGMPTLVAMFGYITADDHPEDWGATALIHEPGEILDWLTP